MCVVHLWGISSVPHSHCPCMGKDIHPPGLFEPQNEFASSHSSSDGRGSSSVVKEVVLLLPVVDTVVLLVVIHFLFYFFYQQQHPPDFRRPRVKAPRAQRLKKQTAQGRPQPVCPSCQITHRVNSSQSHVIRQFPKSASTVLCIN